VSASGAFFYGRSHGDLDGGNVLVPDGGPPNMTSWQIERIVYQLVPPRSSDAGQYGATAGMGEPDSPAVDTGKVVRLLKHWRRIELPASPVEFDRLVVTLHVPDLVARAAARCAVRAAYHARDAVVHHDLSISRPIVARFAARWLGLSPTDENIDATGNALLQALLDGVHPEGDHAAVRCLRADTRDQRRAWRDLGETRLRGARIASLDRPLRPDGPELLTLLDTIGSCDEIGAEADGWDDERIGRVLGALRADERRVTVALGQRYADTWEQAAVLCGLPGTFGERVRRKLKREGAKLTGRLAAVGRQAA
jgi:hypothetical protein